MSQASAAALDALRAIGENIPVDLSPQPISNDGDDNDGVGGEEL